MKPIVENIPCKRQGPVYRASSIPELSTAWQPKDPMQHQPRHIPEYTNFSTRRVKARNAGKSAETLVADLINASRSLISKETLVMIIKARNYLNIQQ